MNKRYYYFQIWEGFFKNKIIKKIAKLPSGDSIVVCYQRLIIATLNTDGWFQFEKIEESLIEELALELDISEDILKFTLAALDSVGLVEHNHDDSAIRILIIDEVMRIGSESESAGRMRKKRAQSKEMIGMQSHDIAQCAHIVRECAQDKEIDIHVDREMIDASSSIIIYYNNIFEDNQKLNNDNIIKITKALGVVTHEKAKKIIRNEKQRLKDGKYKNFYPSLGWMFGAGLKECLQHLEKQNKFNQFPEQNYGDISKLEEELIEN